MFSPKARPTTAKEHCHSSPRTIGELIGKVNSLLRQTIKIPTIFMKTTPNTLTRPPVATSHRMVQAEEVAILPKSPTRALRNEPRSAREVTEYTTALNRSVMHRPILAMVSLWLAAFGALMVVPTAKAYLGDFEPASGYVPFLGPLIPSLSLGTDWQDGTGNVPPASRSIRSPALRSPSLQRFCRRHPSVSPTAKHPPRAAQEAVLAMAGAPPVCQRVFRSTLPLVSSAAPPLPKEQPPSPLPTPDLVVSSALALPP
jgi:hypothetical protein